MEPLFNGFHVGESPGAQIQSGLGLIGDDIGARAAGDDVGVEGDAAARIIPLFNARNLRGKFVNGVDAFFGRESRVRGAAMDDELQLRPRLCAKF